MPVYFVYGFQWPRPGYTGIRAFATIHNLEDCSSEYIQNEHSKAAILQVFRKDHAQIMQDLENKDTGRTLEFIEQYDPQDESSASAASQPYAFVAIHVVTIADNPLGEEEERREPNVGNIPSAECSTSPAAATVSNSTTAPKQLEKSSTTPSRPPAAPVPLCFDVEEIISRGPGLTPTASKAFAELRDKLAEGAKIGWWIVYNGDPERPVYDFDEETESENNSEKESESPDTPTNPDTLVVSELLGQPLPTLIPPDMKDVIVVKSGAQIIGSEEDPAAEATEKTASVPAPEQSSFPTEAAVSTQAKSNKQSHSSGFSFPLRGKSSKAQTPPFRGDDVTDPATLKEINKKEGRRYKFFGGRSEKKST